MYRKYWRLFLPIVFIALLCGFYWLFYEGFFNKSFVAKSGTVLSYKTQSNKEPMKLTVREIEQETVYSIFSKSKFDIKQYNAKWYKISNETVNFAIKDSYVGVTENQQIEAAVIRTPGIDMDLHILTQQLKFPIRVGDSWSSDSGWNTVYQVISDHETVVVPAGTFKNCVVVEAKHKATYEYFYYAPNVGLIKYDHNEKGKRTTNLELQEITLENKPLL